MLITLTNEEFELAKTIGEKRQSEAKLKNLADKHGFDGLSGEEIHIQGACGEFAAALALDLTWDQSVNTFKSRSDLPNKIEVRTRSKYYYDLIVRDNDANDAYFVLVSKKSDLEFEVRGFILGQNAKQNQWSKNYGNRPAAYFISAQNLEPISKLKEMLQMVKK